MSENHFRIPYTQSIPAFTALQRAQALDVSQEDVVDGRDRMPDTAALALVATVPEVIAMIRVAEHGGVPQALKGKETGRDAFNQKVGDGKANSEGKSPGQLR